MILSDAVHGAVQIPNSMSFLLDKKPLARLRNIRQLGFTPSVYTGAVHTRFEHTIGKTAVLMNLMDQFNIRDEHLRERYVFASLLSEIGSFPLSYSTSWLFVHRMNMSKMRYARLLSDTYLEVEKSEQDFIWKQDHSDHSWFSRIPAFSGFHGLTIMKLAGDIDYALRDAHYSGRYSNSFDYRYFKTLVTLDTGVGRAELAESVRELYRSIYALNSVYGDVTRRFITLIFVKLAGFLVDGGYLRLKRYKQPQAYVELDDDQFMAAVRDAVGKAAGDGHVWTETMLRYIEQLEVIDIRRRPVRGDVRQNTLSDVERQIALDYGVDANQVVAINDALSNQLGYVLFGKKFSCYSEAVESQFFRDMTGLGVGSNRTGLLEEEAIFYSVIH